LLPTDVFGTNLDAADAAVVIVAREPTAAAAFRSSHSVVFIPADGCRFFIGESKARPSA
jgi:hypothetical protein